MCWFYFTLLFVAVVSYVWQFKINQSLIEKFTAITVKCDGERNISVGNKYCSLCVIGIKMINYSKVYKVALCDCFRFKFGLFRLCVVSWMCTRYRGVTFGWMHFLSVYLLERRQFSSLGNRRLRHQQVGNFRLGDEASSALLINQNLFIFFN